MEEAAKSPKRRLRFSLRTLMLVTTFVAMGIGLLVSAFHNRRLARGNEALARENRRLRDEVGELSIEDPSRVYAIRVPAGNYLEWTWRVWIPEGHVYRLRCVGGEIPKEGWPNDRGGTIMLREPGERAIQYRIRRHPKNDLFYGSLSTRGASVSRNAHPWVAWPSRTSTTDGVGTSTRVFPPGRRVEICRHRVSQATGSEDIEDPAAGFLIWLEPAL